jgi:pSer/pThr/pTyr-binding forkhead associated (FHA) protein
LPETLLTILKFLMVALVYLFFARVLRAVWAEMAAPARVATAPATSAPRAQPKPAAPRGGGGRPVRLKVVEPPESRGQQYDLTDELTVGRADGCRIRLNDSYTSQLHARLFARDGQYFVEDLGSTNGTFVNNSRISSATTLRRGDRLKIGKTVMEATK